MEYIAIMQFNTLQGKLNGKMIEQSCEKSVMLLTFSKSHYFDTNIIL